MIMISCKPLGLQVGSSNWVHKTQIHSIQRWYHLVPKLANPLSLLERRVHPFYYWIKYSWSASTHILYYINLSVRWNTLLRNQISSCQHVFYYNNMFIEQAIDVTHYIFFLQRFQVIFVMWTRGPKVIVNQVIILNMLSKIL